MNLKRISRNVIGFAVVALYTNSLMAQNAESRPIEAWITKADKTEFFQQQTEKITFGNKKGWGPAIIVDDAQQFQSIDGFGFALTGGSAELLMKMSASARAALLKELFATDGRNIGTSYIRLSIGASDMNSFVFSYNDLPAGETDFELKKFSLSQDLKDVVPVMKEILAINPAIKIMGSPWSAPTWMKTNGKVKGGALKPECYEVYARYFLKYLQAMKKEGIVIDAITVQNEPLNSNNTPSMQWLPLEQTDFIKNHLGPLFKKEGITCKIVIFDHNLDRIDYPLTTLSDPDAEQYVDGSGFHFYGGDFNSMNDLHLARPDKNLYFTEQMTVEKPDKPTTDVALPVKNLIIGATRNWSKNVLLWNLAADPNNDPHTDDGGCPMCQGAVTIAKDSFSRNIAFYTVAHAAKFVRPGSVRIASTDPKDKIVLITHDEEKQTALRVTTAEESKVLPNVAFKTPDGKIVLIVSNDSYFAKAANIQYKGKFASAKLGPGAVATFIW